MQGVDARSYLIGWLKGVSAMTVSDINAIPTDKWTENMGGCTRPANALAADMTGLMMWLIPVLKGEAAPAPDPEASKMLAEKMTDQATAVAIFNETVDNFASAIAGASDELLNSEVPAPWGAPTPVFTLAHIAVSHIWYHDGQFNYVHCLLGDDKIYWMM